MKTARAALLSSVLLLNGLGLSHGSTSRPIPKIVPGQSISLASFLPYDISKPAPWLLSVRSIYTDQKTGRRASYRGSGVLVQIQKKLFALTVSHLSQGEALEVRLGRPKLAP